MIERIRPLLTDPGRARIREVTIDRDPINMGGHVFWRLQTCTVVIDLDLTGIDMNNKEQREPEVETPLTTHRFKTLLVALCQRNGGQLRIGQDELLASLVGNELYVNRDLETGDCLLTVKGGDNTDG